MYSWNFFLTLPPYLEFYSVDHRKIKIVKINQKKLKFLTYTIIPCNILFYFVQRNRSKNQHKDKNVYTVHFNNSVYRTKLNQDAEQFYLWVPECDILMSCTYIEFLTSFYSKTTQAGIKAAVIISIRM